MNRRSEISMHIPVSRREISQFTQLSIYSVGQAWFDGRLQRSIFLDGRLSSELAHSSIFDVVEFLLFRSEVVAPIAKDHCAMWVCYLCELSELDSWTDFPIPSRRMRVFQCAVEDGLCLEHDQKAHQIAKEIVGWQEDLLQLCLENDARSSLISV